MRGIKFPLLIIDPIQIILLSIKLFGENYQQPMAKIHLNIKNIYENNSYTTI